MTSTEFLKWVWYLEWCDTEEFSRQDYYLAQIAAQIEQGRTTRRVTIESKLLKFRTGKGPPVDVEARMQKSKAFWLGSTKGIGRQPPKRRDHGIQPKPG